MKDLFAFCLSTIFFLANVPVFSQDNSQKRIEFDLKDSFDDEKIYVFGSKGFIMSSRNDQAGNGESEWRYELFDTELKSEKNRSVKINRKFVADETYSNESGLHTIYRDNPGNFNLVSVQATGLEIEQARGKLPKRTFLWGMAVLGDFAFLNASIKKKPFLISVNRHSGETNLIQLVIKGYKPKRTSILRMQVLEKTNEVLVFLEATIKKRKNEIYVIRLNSNGEKGETYHLTERIDANIIDISGSNVGGNQYVFTGTYSKSNIYNSEGMFFCKVQNGLVDFIKFYNYTKLKEFFSFLPEKSQKKVEKEVAKNEKKGKETVYNYLMTDHEVLKIGNDFLFLGEVYYRTYRTEVFTTYTTTNGVTTVKKQTREVFDGFQYTHAVLVKYDANGELLWDRAFQMWPIHKPYYPQRFISPVLQNNEAINLVFCSENRIISKSYNLNGDILSDRKSNRIEASLTGDKALYTFSNIEYWYDGFFLAYGNQEIKNKEDKFVRKKRKVYFISKIGV